MDILPGGKVKRCFVIDKIPHVIGMGWISICCGEYDGYDNPKDVIAEQMIQSFKLSVNELLVCNEMSVSSLITEHRGYQTKLKDFKKAISDHCQEMGYI